MDSTFVDGFDFVSSISWFYKKFLRFIKIDLLSSMIRNVKKYEINDNFFI